MINRVTASQFERFMATGRTSPAMFGCEDQTGTMVGEYLVKWRAAIEEFGSLNELIASVLADHLGIAVPEPALVFLDPVLADLVARAEPSKADVIRGSSGLNFGTKVLSGVSTWPVDKSIPAALRQVAAEIFAFDALIQNPDRRFDNPNLFTCGDRLVIFDHETAFSFAFALFPSTTPWNLDDQQYLTRHVFYRALKSQSIDFSRFEASLGGLSDALIERLVAHVPSEWNNDNMPKIVRHLRLMRDHSAEFVEAVRRMLV